MKRLFYFPAVLLSAHYLLAQTSSQPDQRIKNQVTGGRLQGAGNRRTTSLSEDQILSSTAAAVSTAYSLYSACRPNRYL